MTVEKEHEEPGRAPSLQRSRSGVQGDDDPACHRVRLHGGVGRRDLLEREDAPAQLSTTAWPVGVHSPGFVAATDEEAREVLWPHFKVNRDRIGASRGWPPMQRDQFDAEIEHGSLYVGSPETVAKKIATTITSLDIGRFDLIYTAGTVPASARLKHVELYGSRVLPLVKQLLTEQPTAAGRAA